MYNCDDYSKDSNGVRPAWMASAIMLALVLAFIGGIGYHARYMTEDSQAEAVTEDPWETYPTVPPSKYPTPYEVPGNCADGYFQQVAMIQPDDTKPTLPPAPTYTTAPTYYEECGGKLPMPNPNGTVPNTIPAPPGTDLPEILDEARVVPYFGNEAITLEFDLFKLGERVVTMELGGCYVGPSAAAIVIYREVDELGSPWVEGSIDLSKSEAYIEWSGFIDWAVFDSELVSFVGFGNYLVFHLSDWVGERTMELFASRLNAAVKNHTSCA